MSMVWPTLGSRTAKNGTDIGTQQGRDAVAVHAVAAVTVATSFRCRRHNRAQLQTCVMRRL